MMGEGTAVIVSVVGVGVAILIALAVFDWRLSAQLTLIESRTERIDPRLNGLKTGLN